MTQMIQALRLRYGLRWRGNYPSFSFLIPVIKIIILILIYAYLQEQDFRHAQEDLKRAKISESKALKLFQDCLNRKGILLEGDVAIFCDASEEMKI